MKLRFFFLFLILIPNINALAVSPTRLEFKTIQDETQEKEFFIYNNNDYKTNFSIKSNEFFTFSQNSIELDPMSSKKVKAILNSNNLDQGTYESKIYIKENVNNKGITLENGLAIKTFIEVFSDDVKMKKLSNEITGYSVNKITNNYAFVLLGIVAILALVSLIKRFK